MDDLINIFSYIVTAMFFLFLRTEETIRDLLLRGTWRAAFVRLRRQYVRIFDHLYGVKARFGGIHVPSPLRIVVIGTAALITTSLVPFVVNCVDLMLFVREKGIPAEFTAVEPVAALAGEQAVAPLIPRPDFALRNQLLVVVYDHAIAAVAVLFAAVPLVLVVDYVSVAKTRLFGALARERNAFAFVALILIEAYLALSISTYAANVVGKATLGVQDWIVCKQSAYAISVSDEGALSVTTVACPVASLSSILNPVEDVDGSFRYSPSPAYLLSRLRAAAQTIIAGYAPDTPTFYGSFSAVTTPDDALFHAVFNVALPALNTTPHHAAASALISGALTSVWLWLWTLFGGLVWIGGRQKAIADFIQHRLDRNWDIRAMIAAVCAIVYLVYWSIDKIIRTLL